MASGNNHTSERGETFLIYSPHIYKFYISCTYNGQEKGQKDIKWSTKHDTEHYILNNTNPTKYQRLSQVLQKRWMVPAPLVIPAVLLFLTMRSHAWKEDLIVLTKIGIYPARYHLWHSLISHKKVINITYWLNTHKKRRENTGQNRILEDTRIY